MDILEDNAHDCRKRLLGIVKRESKAAIKSAVDPLFLESVSYVLEKNILCGDALTLKSVEGEPIAFAEWSIVTGDKVKRHDYLLSELLERVATPPTLFDKNDGTAAGWEYDEETMMAKRARARSTEASLRTHTVTAKPL